MSCLLTARLARALMASSVSALSNISVSVSLLGRSLQDVRTSHAFLMQKHAKIGAGPLQGGHAVPGREAFAAGFVRPILGYEHLLNPSPTPLSGGAPLREQPSTGCRRRPMKRGQ